jgi:hypothetical protein
MTHGRGNNRPYLINLSHAAPSKRRLGGNEAGESHRRAVMRALVAGHFQASTTARWGGRRADGKALVEDEPMVLPTKVGSGPQALSADVG